MEGKVCPELLLKAELLYEIRCHGVEVDDKTTVSDLRKKWRDVKSLKISKNFSSLRKSANGNFNNEVLLGKTTLEELGEKVQDLKENPTGSEIVRVTARLTHWCERLLNLYEMYNVKNQEKEALDNLIGQYQELLSELSPLEKEKQADCIRVIDVLNQTFQDREEVNLNSLAAQVPSPSRSVGEAMSAPHSKSTEDAPYSNLFAKLPHPVENYLKNLKMTNGLNVGDLLNFLKVINKIKRETSLTDSVILELVLGYSSVPFHELLLRGKIENYTYNEIHRQALSQFVPLSLREQLKREYVMRPQRYRENLYEYVEEVKLYNELLRLHYTEEEVTELIKTGLNPETRGRLTFGQNPKCYADLDRLCVYYQNVAYEDLSREQQSRSVNVYQKPTSYVNRSPVQPRVEVRSCFRCGKPGHLSRDCKVKLNPQGPRPSFQNNRSNAQGMRNENLRHPSPPRHVTKNE